MEVLVLVSHEYRVVRWGIPATDAFIMMHPDFPNKDLYVTQKMVHITEEDREEDFFDCEEQQTPLEAAYIAESEFLPLEDGVERFRYKEGKDTPLPILPSGSRGVTVTKYDIATLRHEGIVVEDDNDPDPVIFFTQRMS